MSTGAAEVILILTALSAGWPLPLLAAQILWLNLVTNGLQDVALAFEPGEPGVLRRAPRPRTEGVMSRLLVGTYAGHGTRDASTRALEFALSLAEEADARLILLYVIEGFIDPGQLCENVHFTVPEYRQYLEQDAMDRLKAAVPEEARVWCKPEERLTSGTAYREILEWQRKSRPN